MKQACKPDDTPWVPSQRLLHVKNQEGLSNGTCDEDNSLFSHTLLDQKENQPIDRIINKSIIQIINHPINQPSNQLISQLINQLIDQLIN